jgi:hypothetical protein
MSEWQPIETAPKDGTRIILGADLNVDPELWASWWIGGDDRWANTPDWMWFTSPTHWMPLPSPPKVQP